MRSQLNDETDDELFDDPIKLFDSEHDRVHFGSQTIQDNVVYKGTVISAFKQSIEDIRFEKDAESIKTVENDLESFSERDCCPLHIKLVDCSKFPWYYKKYTQQILDKTNICDLVSDSDSEIDIELIDDTSDDCIIIDDIVKESNKVKNKDNVPSHVIWPSVTLKTTAEKRQDAIKRKEDIELQKALNQKNTGTVDFKRNKGLVGMTITQKYVKDINYITAEPRVNKTLITEVKKEQKFIAKSSISTTGKALNSTEASTASNKSEVKNYTSEEHQGSTADVLIEKISVKFGLGKISEELVEHLTTKKRYRSQDTKLPNKKIKTHVNKQKSDSNTSSLFKLSSSPNTVKGSAPTVKNVKDTTKYKKNVFENKFLELLTIEKNKTLNNEAKKSDKNANGEEKSRKYIEKKYEPNSPILPCSTLAKKNRNMNENVKVLETFKVEDNIKEKKSTSKSDTVGQVVNKSISCNFYNTGNMQRTLNESKIDSKKLHSEVKDIDGRNEAKEMLKEAPLQYNVLLKSNVPISDIQSFSPSHTNISSTIQSRATTGYNVYNNLPINSNVSSNPIQLCFVHPANVTSYIPNANGMNNSNNIASGNNVVAANQWTNIDSTTTPTSSATVITTQCKPISITNNCDNTKLINSYDLPIRNESGNEAILNHLNNVPSHNSYTSAIILKPTQTKAVSSGSGFNHPILNTQGPPKLPVQMKPRFYHNPYKPNHYRLPHNQEQRFIPRMTNCAMANYRFPTPHNNSSSSWYNPPPFSSSHTGWHMPNIFQKSRPRRECPRNIFPPRLPISVLQTTTTPISAKLGFASQSDNIAKPKMNIFQDYSSQVLNKNEETAKIKNQDPRRITHSYKEDIKSNVNNVISDGNSDLVTSKTKMLELLDSATNHLKRMFNEDDDDMKKKLDDIFKRPKISNYEEITIDKDYSREIDQQKGYSPPILPIPTFEKVLDRVKIDVQKQDKHNVRVNLQKNVSEMKYVNQSNKKVLSDQSQESARKRKIRKNNKIIYMNDCNNRVVSSKSKESTTKEEIKKISLEEYKKRTLSHRPEDCNKTKGDTNDFNEKRKLMYNKPKTGVDRRSTESDHGYNSDSTVIL